MALLPSPRSLLRAAARRGEEERAGGSVSTSRVFYPAGLDAPPGGWDRVLGLIFLSFSGLGTPLCERDSCICHLQVSVLTIL